MQPISNTMAGLALAFFVPAVSANTIVVTQSGFGFVPRDVTIQVGDTVQWNWTSFTHTVTEGTDGTIDGNEAFHSPLSAGTPTVSVTFDAAFLALHPKPCNFYDYFCFNHFMGNMKGTIQIAAADPGTIYCFGDGSLPTPCPCALPDTVPNPSGGPSAGCANSFRLAGARLCAAGTSSPDTLVFTADIGPNYLGFAFLVKGSASDSNGIATNDGLRCADGALIRFGAHNAGTNGAPAGLWTYPNTAQVLPVSTATAQPAATSAFYQLFYRNAAAGFCNPSTANFSNGYRVDWP